MRRKPTHFISVPATPAIQEGLKNFKDLVLNDRDVKIEDAFFQVPEKLHVTICVMTLESDEDRQRAVECLNRVKDTIWRPIFERSGPIKLQFAGLQTFQRNQRHANVVFGKILSANFAVFADEVCQEFVDKQLVERHTLTSQYHLTLLNSHFLDKSIRRITTTFDASRLLDKFRDYSFGEMLVDELHLLRMGARDENGYYEITEKNSVLNDPDVTIEEVLFQVPEKLHVTVCLMSLNSEEERQRAVQCLNEVKETVWRPIFEHSGPIKARFSGLGTFQKNHRRAYVVYGNVLSDNFAMFANGICEEYVEKQLVERQSLSSRYHLTVLNSQFLEKSIRRITPNFDATRLLRKYRGYNFGEMIVDELHLSKIGSRDENGCYEVIGKVNL